MHFYESSIITTKDGLHCQVYGNEHPKEAVLVKPKYIPTDKIESSVLPYRFISSRKMNRLNFWVEKEGLRQYIENFTIAYPYYLYKSSFHDSHRLFFAVPIEQIERIYFPRRGLKELMSMPLEALDPHLRNVYQFVQLLVQSGLRLKDLGVTYSTLMGHYMQNISDINIVVYGKEQFWKLMSFMEKVQHPSLRWKSDEEWQEFLQKRSRFHRFGKEFGLRIMKRKHSEGFFNDTLFVIFAAEKEEEVWFKWGEEQYQEQGLVTVQATVVDNKSSVVRPGCYEVSDVIVMRGENKENIKKIVFYNRDYCMVAFPGEKIEARGILEKVIPKNGEKYHRVVVGYLDAYISDRREEEFIKLKE